MNDHRRGARILVVMQPGLTSVWATLIPAILAGSFGIVGVMVGQLINARRERTREDTRWKREQEKEDNKTTHGVIEYWREKRLETCLEYLAALTRVAREADRLLRHVELGYDDEGRLLITLDEDQQTLEDIQIRHILLAAPEVTTRTPHVFMKLAKYVARVSEAYAQMSQGEQITPEQLEALGGVGLEFRAEMTEYLVAIRQTSGVDHPEIHYLIRGLPPDGMPLPLNSSRPPATNS